MKREKKEKKGFFKKVKNAIFNFDEYSNLSKEKLSKTIGYLFILITIMAFFITITTTYKTYQIANNTVALFKNEAPNFEIKDGILEVEDNKKYEYIDEDGYFAVIIDETRQTADDIEYLDGAIFAKDQLFLKTSGRLSAVYYKDLINQDVQKSDVENFLTKENILKVYAFLGVIMLITNFIAYIMILFINVLTISIIGMIVNWIAQTKLTYKNVFSMSAYAITLPAILLTIYVILTTLTNFTVKYFNIAYDIISYIYIITAILMIKSDLIKNKQELFVKEPKKEDANKINNEVKRKEKNSKGDNKRKDKKEKKKEKGKEKNTGEPEGSNA